MTIVVCFKSPKPPSPPPFIPPPPPPIPAEDPEKKKAEEEKVAEKKKEITRRIGRGATIATTPLGVSGQAPVYRPTLG